MPLLSPHTLLRIFADCCAHQSITSYRIQVMSPAYSLFCSLITRLTLVSNSHIPHDDKPRSTRNQVHSDTVRAQKVENTSTRKQGGEYPARRSAMRKFKSLQTIHALSKSKRAIGQIQRSVRLPMITVIVADTPVLDHRIAGQRPASNPPYAIAYASLSTAAG